MTSPIPPIFFYDSVFVRTAGSQFRTPFHQDEPYWSVKGFDCASAWMPLVPVEKRSALERDDVVFDNSGTVPFPDIEGNRDGYDMTFAYIFDPKAWIRITASS